MPTQREEGTERAHENIGHVHAERVGDGMRLNIFCPAWAQVVERAPVVYERHSVCKDATPRKIHRVPDGISLTVRESGAIFQGGGVNLLPLLSAGLGADGGATFTFPGVFTAEVIKETASAFKRFLVNFYRDYSRPVTVRYTIVADSE